MTKLRVLDASGSCRISNEGISNIISLENLNAGYNPRITNINHMTKLIVLNASGKCGLNDEGIINLKQIKRLNRCGNSKISQYFK